MLREIFSQGSKATKNEGVQIDENPGMKGCLEWMHEMLIGLVANLLDGMKPEDKLIIVAPEVCNSVYDDAKSWSQSLICFDLRQLKTSDTQEFHVVQQHSVKS
jgi:hypothetical protein